MEADATDPITKANFLKRAEAFIAAMSKDARQNLPTIELGSPDYVSWLQYFDWHLRWRPMAFQALVDKKLEVMTVPARLPSWFDTAFAENPRWRPTLVRSSVPREQHETLEQLRARFGPNWGIKQMIDKPKKAFWVVPSDDALRAHYGTREEPA